MEITAKSAHRSVQRGVVKQDKKEEMNFVLGSLLGSFQTILDENSELVATIECREKCFYSIEIKGKDRNTWS